MYMRSLLSRKCLSLPLCTLAYEGSAISVQGGYDIFANRPKGGRAIREMLFVVNSVSSRTMTSWTSGCEGRCQCGVRGAIFWGGRASFDVVVFWLVT